MFQKIKQSIIAFTLIVVGLTFSTLISIGIIETFDKLLSFFK